MYYGCPCAGNRKCKETDSLNSVKSSLKSHILWVSLYIVLKHIYRSQFSHIFCSEMFLKSFVQLGEPPVHSSLKMTVDGISSNPPLVERHVRFTMVPFILMEFFNRDFSAGKKKRKYQNLTLFRDGITTISSSLLLRERLKEYLCESQISFYVRYQNDRKLSLLKNWTKKFILMESSIVYVVQGKKHVRNKHLASCKKGIS